MSSTTPKRIDPRVRQLLAHLELSEETACWLEFLRPKKFIPERSECHINAWIQSRYEGGSISTGWVVWQDHAADFVEAQFHTVWKDPNRVLRDVTPRQDRERTVLFVPDTQRTVRFIHYDDRLAVVIFDNVRMREGTLLNGLRERTHILTTALIYEHGLAMATTDK